MQLTLVVPELGRVAEELRASAPSLARLASPDELHLDLDAAIIRAAGAPPDTPIAPLAARGAGFDPGAAYTLRADPVAFVAGRDDVLLAGRVSDLTAEEASALQARLNDHFAADGMAFHAPRPDAWFVTAREHVPVTTHSLASIAGPIEPHLPQGDNGRTWRRWLSEMQMILHDNAINAQREAKGLSPVTGIWIAAGGVMPATVPVDAEVYAARGYRGDVARGLPATSLTPTGFVSLRANARAIVVTEAVTDAQSIAAVARLWLEPALAALDQGKLERLDVIGDGGSRTLQWHPRKASWWQRLRTMQR